MLDFNLLSAFGGASTASPAVDPLLADMFAPSPGGATKPVVRAGAESASEVARWLETLPALGYMLSSTLTPPSA
jgi:hypothetical protein